MARTKYGQTPADYGSDPQTVGGVANVNVFAGVTLYMFDGDDYATCTQVTDLLDQTGAAATSITAAATGLIYFQGPDGTDTDLYGCVDETPDANSVFYRFPPALDNIVARLEVVEAAASLDLDDLGDVNTTGKADGDALVYVAATQTWVADAVSAGGGASGLDDLTDVTISGPETGEAPVYNGSAFTNQHVWRRDPDVTTQAQYDASSKTTGILYAIS